LIAPTLQSGNNTSSSHNTLVHYLLEDMYTIAFRPYFGFLHRISREYLNGIKFKPSSTRTSHSHTSTYRLRLRVSSRTVIEFQHWYVGSSDISQSYCSLSVVIRTNGDW